MNAALVLMGVVPCFWPSCKQETPEWQIDHGCFQNSPVPIVYECSGKVYKFWRCPGGSIDPRMAEYVQHWILLKRWETLPAEGGFMDQTWSFVESTMLLELVCADAMKEAEKRQRSDG